MRPPPSRYRVVERGRRLEVIDTRQRGVARAPADPARRGSIADRLPRRIAFDGSARLVTARFYDDKGPRTIALDPANATIVRWAEIGLILVAAICVALVVFAPWLLVVIPLLADKRVRQPVRAAVTRWLDTVEREAG